MTDIEKNYLTEYGFLLHRFRHQHEGKIAIRSHHARGIKIGVGVRRKTILVDYFSVILSAFVVLISCLCPEMFFVHNCNGEGKGTVTYTHTLFMIEPAHWFYDMAGLAGWLVVSP
jgi:hypothetical protein